MMREVSRNSSRRIRDVRTLLRVIRRLSPGGRAAVVSPEVLILKGLFFVHLYSALEFTVTGAVQGVIHAINSSSHLVCDCHPQFLSMALHAECESMAGVGKSKTWERRWHLFSRVFSTVRVEIDDTLMPTDGRNIGYAQLQSIWTSFNVDVPVLPRMSLRGRLEELVNNRNAIAHGREAAAAVGGRYSTRDLETRLSDVQEICEHVMTSLESCVQRMDFKR